MRKFEVGAPVKSERVLDQGWVVLFDNGDYYSSNAASFFRTERNAEQKCSWAKSMSYIDGRGEPRVVKVKLVAEE